MARDKSPPPQPGAVVKTVSAPKLGATTPTAAKPAKAVNPIGRLGDYAHPPKGKKK
jgi:hypothetical protein